MLEIYNETVRDLLAPSEMESKHVATFELRERDGLIEVGGLTTHQVKSSQQLSALMQSGNQNRAEGCTQINDKSSRSHCVVMLTARVQPLPGCQGTLTTSKLIFVDLAGSECVGMCVTFL